MNQYIWSYSDFHLIVISKSVEKARMRIIKTFTEIESLTKQLDDNMKQYVMILENYGFMRKKELMLKN